MAKKTYRRPKKKSPGRRLASFTPLIKPPTKRAVSDSVTANPLPQHTSVGPVSPLGPTLARTLLPS